LFNGIGKLGGGEVKRGGVKSRGSQTIKFFPQENVLLVILFIAVEIEKHICICAAERIHVNLMFLEVKWTNTTLNFEFYCTSFMNINCNLDIFCCYFL
jgi:hypothetical protein